VVYFSGYTQKTPSWCIPSPSAISSLENSYSPFPKESFFLVFNTIFKMVPPYHIFVLLFITHFTFKFWDQKLPKIILRMIRSSLGEFTRGEYSRYHFSNIQTNDCSLFPLIRDFCLLLFFYTEIHIHIKFTEKL